MVLIMLSSFDFNKNKEKINTDNTNAEYIENMEKRIKDLIEQTNGAGECEVLITLESGEENIYAVEKRLSKDLSEDTDGEVSKRIQKSDNTEDSYIIIDSENGKQALIKKVLEPKVQGVVIICDGGENQIVIARITEIITTALNIPSTKVCVSPKSFKK